MRVVFFGAKPGVGTSANMQLAVCATAFYPHRSDESAGLMQFTDCGGMNPMEQQQQISVNDLLAINLSLTGSGLEEFYLNRSFVHQNIIFLVGKYYHSQKRELNYLSLWYRIPKERICPIPYNQRFRAAYESGCIPAYLRWQERENSLENMEFGQSLKRLFWTISKYGKRKGEIYYG